MEAIVFFSLLIAVDNHIFLGLNSHVGQLPCLFYLVFGADLVVLEINRLITGVVQLNPRIGEFMDVVHNTFYI